MFSTGLSSPKTGFLILNPSKDNPSSFSFEALIILVIKLGLLTWFPMNYGFSIGVWWSFKLTSLRSKLFSFALKSVHQDRHLLWFFFANGPQVIFWINGKISQLVFSFILWVETKFCVLFINGLIWPFGENLHDWSPIFS
jgi:hypothetical protein